MTRLSFSSLRARLGLYLLIAIVPAFGLTLYTGLEQREQAAVHAEEEALRLARLSAGYQTTVLDGARQLLLTLAQLPEVRQQNAEGCTALFGDALKQYPRYVNIVAAAANGDVFCSALPRTGKAPNVGDKAWFQKAIETRSFALSDYEIGKISGQAEVHVAQAVLTGRTGTAQVGAVVFVGLDLTWINSFAAQGQLPEGSALLVLDQNGTILARYPESIASIGQSMHEIPLAGPVLEHAGDAGNRTTGQVTDERGVSYPSLPPSSTPAAPRPNCASSSASRLPSPLRRPTGS